MPSCAAIAFRIKALLFGSLFRNSASFSSTLKATTAVFGGLRDTTLAPFAAGRHFTSVHESTRAGNRDSGCYSLTGKQLREGEPMRKPFGCLILLIAVSTAAAGNWPQWRGPA